MSQIIKIEDFSAPELDIFVRLTGAELRRGIEEGQGILIAESTIVVDVALRSGIEPIALLTDERLLEMTGGIVQGMSGSPIVQNGKLVGAVTHVLVNDPTRGYGIFIENMLEAAE
jgi:hypothetical protein